MVPACHRDEYKRHDGGNQDTHRVAHLEEDERRRHHAGRHTIATPDEGCAATISGEGKIEKEEGKAPEGKGGPTAVAAEVHLRIAITVFKAFRVAIHTEKRVERHRGTYEAEERHGA